MNRDFSDDRPLHERIYAMLHVTRRTYPNGLTTAHLVELLRGEPSYTVSSMLSKMGRAGRIEKNYIRGNKTKWRAKP